MTSKVKKISVITNTDMKLVMRNFNIISSVFIYIGFVIVMFYLNQRIKQYPLIITPIWFLIMCEPILNNVLSRSKHEFRTYCVLSIPPADLLIAKNISNAIVITAAILFMNIVISIIVRSSIDTFIRELLIFFPTLFILLIMGNFLSIWSQRGMNKRLMVSTGFMFMHIIVLCSSLLLSRIIIEHGSWAYAVYLILIIGLFYFSLKKMSLLLLKYRFNIMEWE